MVVVAGVALVWVVGVTFVDLAVSDFMLVLPTKEGFQQLTEADVTRVQQLVIGAVLASTNVCWAWGLVEMIRLGWLCRTGLELTARAAAKFQGFGYALLAMAVCELAAIPVIAAYLRHQKLMDPAMGIWDGLLRGGGLQTLAAAVLVAVTARVIRLSASLAEESELTV